MNNEFKAYELGVRLRLARIEAGHQSPHEFAALVERATGKKMDVNKLQRIEAGRQEPKASDLAAILAVLGKIDALPSLIRTAMPEAWHDTSNRATMAALHNSPRVVVYAPDEMEKAMRATVEGGSVTALQILEDGRRALWTLDKETGAPYMVEI